MTKREGSQKPTVVIAGASGCIGQWFMECYRHKYHFIALTRKEVLHNNDEGIEWRQVELYSITSTIEATRDADYAIYLVHSMNPSTRLNQGSFDVTDLLLADNFSRAAEKNAIKQILFISGILPKDDFSWSKHLRSRYEVEQTLGSRGTPVTSLRAGIIIGPGGSSFRIMKKLVENLPAMACPTWTNSESQPISVYDTMYLMDMVLGNGSYYHKHFEIGGREKVTYQRLLEITTEVMQKKRLIFAVPIDHTRFSKFWVALFTGSSTTFTSPLIESLKHNLTLDSALSLQPKEYQMPELRAMIADALDSTKAPRSQSEFAVPKQETNTVRSYQRLENRQRKPAYWIAETYRKWLPLFFRYLIRATQEPGNEVHFKLFALKEPLLKLRLITDRSSANRHLFYIVGGVLCKRQDTGWLEFRNVLNRRYVIAAIHEFVPSLPWYVYIFTQAQFHLFVMRSFGRYLRKAPQGNPAVVSG